MAHSPADWTLGLSRAIRDCDKPVITELVSVYQQRADTVHTSDSFQWLERTRSLVSKSADRCLSTRPPKQPTDCLVSDLRLLCRQQLQMQPLPKGSTPVKSQRTDAPLSPCCDSHSSPAGLPTAVCTHVPSSPLPVPASPTAVLCFQQGDKFVPAKDMIDSKKAELRTMLERADSHVRQLSTDIGRVVTTRDLVQQQAVELQRVIRSKCSEVRTAVEIREGVLSSQLDKMKKQRDEDLVERGHNLKDVVVRMQHLCSSLSSMLQDSTGDPNQFMANLTVPEMQLAEMLSQDFSSSSAGSNESLGLSLNLDSVLTAINAVELLDKPSEAAVVGQQQQQADLSAVGFHEQKVAFRTSLVLELAFSKWLSDKDLQDSIQALLAAHAGVHSEGCRVVSVRAGSTVIDFELVIPETLAATVLANLERLHQSVTSGEFHLHGVPVLTMSAPVRLKQPSSEVPIDDALDAVIAKKSQFNSIAKKQKYAKQLGNIRSTGFGPKASPAQLEIMKDKPSAVVNSEELWAETGKVAFTVNEHSNSVSFVGSNFDEVPLEIAVSCSGTNIEPLEALVVLPVGLTGCAIGRSHVIDPKRAWAYEYQWSVLGAVREDPQVRTGAAIVELREALAAAVAAKDKAVKEEEFVLAAKLHTQCQELRKQVSVMSHLPNLSELQEDLEMLGKKKAKLVDQENFIEAAAVKQQIEEVQKIVDSAIKMN